MKNYLKIKEIEDRVSFINLVFTKKELDGKSIDDMKSVCIEENMKFQNLTSNIQIHSDIVNEVTLETIGKKIEGDALVTNISKTPLLVFTADCVPIAIIDEKNKAIGVVHAGWKGTYSKICAKTIEKMQELYGSNVEDLICVIGPSIGPCCYKVSEDLIQKFNTILTNKDEKFYIIEEGEYYLDLWTINEIILKSIGIKKSNIINMNECTSCNKDKYHSYRAHNKTPKRVGMILEIK